MGNEEQRMQQLREAHAKEIAQDERHLAHIMAILMAPFMDRVHAQVPEDRIRHMKDRIDLCHTTAKNIIERSKR